MQMEMYMKVIGKMIKLMVKENIFIWTELNTKEIGMRINNMDLVKRDGLI